MVPELADVISIAGRHIGVGQPAYVIAEISGNHRGKLANAVKLVRAAADAGADAVKLQTYTPDTLTMDSEHESFNLSSGTIWDGRRLYSLYAEAMTPWEWHKELKDVASECGIHLFSAPFDATAVSFLVELEVPALKIASPEIVDLNLVQMAAATGMPLIISTGMATLAEVDAAVETARAAGATELALLRCSSAYPAAAEDMNLRTIPHMAASWGVPIGLSDHTLGTTAAAVAVALGACIVEKHITLARSDGGPDAAFSLEPHEFQSLVSDIRAAEASLGRVRYGPTLNEEASLLFRRSLYVTRDTSAGEPFTSSNVRSIRPAAGLLPRHLNTVLEMRASRDISAGTPLEWNMVCGEEGDQVSRNAPRTRGNESRQ